MKIDQLTWIPEIKGYEAAETDTHEVHILEMLFNHRVVLTRKGQLESYDTGWCYPDLPSAYAAVATWNPDTEPEPTGYIKRVGT